MLFALPTYQFPYIVMKRCLYLRPWLLRILEFSLIESVVGFILGLHEVSLDLDP
jgi:hypothetical protein